MQLKTRLTNITGPGAPHYYKFVRRGDLGLPLSAEHGHLGAAELHAELIDFPAHSPKDGRDVMVVVKGFMGDAAASQVIALVPFSARSLILDGMRLSRSMPSADSIQSQVKFESPAPGMF